MADSLDRLQRSSVNRQQTSSSSKNAGRFPASQKSWRFLVSQSDLQCFSHEDGCFAAGNEMQDKPALTVYNERDLNLRIRETQNDRAVILWYNTGSEKEYLHG